MKAGDIAVIGKHRLMCGDSTNTDDISKLMNGQKANIVITDPPYLTTDLKMDKDGINLDKFALNIKNNTVENSWVFVYGVLDTAIAFRKIFRRKFEYIWIKKAAIAQHNTVRPLSAHEICWAFIHPELKKMNDLYFDKKALRHEADPYVKVQNHTSKSEYTTSNRMSAYLPDKSVNSGYREGITVVYFPNKSTMPFKDRTSHPTQKPQAMYELLLRAYCPPGGIIFEPCGGSGTGMAAAESLGHACYMMEKEPKYCDIITNRMKSIQKRLEAYRG